MNRSIAGEAVVLSSRDYSEADKIITLFTKYSGKMTTMAKGVKRPKSRKRGTLEVFSQIKFSAHRGSGMPILTETETINNFPKIRPNLAKVSVAYFFLEAVARTIRDEEANDEIYSLLVENLNALEEAKNLKKIRNNFSIALMESLGFIPEGQHVPSPDELLESIIERKLASVRVGKKLQR
jgi:DNA repair protein RecO (recombination protein O)